MDIVEEAKKQPIKPSSSEIRKAIKILEEKGFNSRDIAKFLNERNIKINYTTVYRRMSGRNKGEKFYIFDYVDDFERVIRGFPPQAQALAEEMRLDTETQWPEPELRSLFETAKKTGASNVGGIWDIQKIGDTLSDYMVHGLLSHSFGIGNSGFRNRFISGEVDTVPYGFFKKEVFENRQEWVACEITHSSSTA